MGTASNQPQRNGSQRDKAIIESKNKIIEAKENEIRVFKEAKENEIRVFKEAKENEIRVLKEKLEKALEEITQLKTK
jgi:hypothetical protein